MSGPNLNRELLLSNASPNVRKVVDQVIPNLQSAVDDVIERFKKDIRERQDGFISTDFANRLEEEQNKISENARLVNKKMEDYLDEVTIQLKAIKEIQVTNPESLDALNQAKENLSTKSKELSDEIERLRKQVGTVGNTIGKLGRATIKQFLPLP